MAKVKVSAKFRDFWQKMAIIGGLLLIVPNFYLLQNFDLPGWLRIFTFVEIGVGLATIAVDGWFLWKT